MTLLKLNMKRRMPLAAMLIAASAMIATPAVAEITEGDFKSAFEKYLGTETGQETIGKAMQDYFRKQQVKARAEQAKQQQASVEDQFKNPIKVDAGNSPFKGPKDAKVTIIEFSDFECPFCSKGNNTMMEVLKAYPKDVKVVFKNLPLPFHKNAEPAARAALAAGEQGKFWEMHDVLFKNQRNLKPALFEKTAKDLGLDMEKYKKDYESAKLKKQVADDTALARKIGISGTPGFVVNGVLVKGAYPVDHFKGIIDRWLSDDPTKPAAKG